MGSSVHTDWEGLIARHDHAVVLSLLARGLRIDEAREVAHDAWARLFEESRAGRLRRLELPGLAIRQALFLASDFRRAQRRLGVRPEALDLVDPRPSAEARVELRQVLEQVKLAAATLSPRAQVVFTTVMGNPDLPQVELAGRLGISLQRLRQSLCEVRARLKAVMR